MRLGGALTVAAVGRLKESWWRDGQAEYAKRLGRYTDFRLVEVKDAGPAEEGKSLLAVKAARRVALAPGPEAPGSEVLARKLSKWIETYGSVVFLIGGPTGLSKEVMDTCPEKLSLSSLTFPHEMARVVLLEQLYRAATILGGEKYHK